MRKLTLLSLFWFTLGVSSSAHARIATIRWEKVANAVRYEIRIVQGGEDVINSVSEGASPSWRGALSPGYFVYQIRAVDKLQVAGEWTSPQLILVKPRAVQTLSPGDRAQLKLTEKEGRLFLRWRSMGKRVKYLVEIKLDKLRYERTVSEREYEIENPTSGNVRWRVTPLIQAEGAVDSSVLGEFTASTKGETGKWQEFDLELDAGYLKAKQRFLAPVVEEIPARLPVPYGRSVEVKWQGVEAAEAYEVKYSAIPHVPYRNLSSVEKRTVTVATQEPRFEVPVENGKRYEVTVRALSRLDSRGIASIVSPETKASFEIDDSAASPRPLHFIRFQSSVAPYRDHRISPSQSYEGDIDGAGVGMEFSFRYFLLPEFQIDAQAFLEIQDVEGQRDVRTEWKMFGHYVWNVGGSAWGLAVKPGLGLANLGFTILSPDATGTTTSRAQADGFAVVPSLEVEKQLGEKWQLTFDVKAPLLLSSSNAGSVRKLQSTWLSNYRLALWVQRELGQGLNLSFLIAQEKRAATFLENGVAGASTSQDATRAGLGVAYSW